MAESRDVDIPRIERVPVRRNRVLLGGIISFDHGKNSYNCSIRDLTDRGARIIVAEQRIAPNFYLITIRDRVVFDAKVVWRSGSELGVSFEKSFRLSDIVDPALSYLSDLWYAQAPR
jgi:hypothetical protein